MGLAEFGERLLLIAGGIVVLVVTLAGCFVAYLICWLHENRQRRQVERADFELRRLNRKQP